MVDRGEEESAPVAIAYPVVRSECGRDGGPSAEQPIFGPRSFGDLAEADECHLGRIDHPEDLINAEIPEVSDGDGRITHLRTPQPTDAGPCDEITQRHHEVIEPQCGRVVDGGCDDPSAAQ